MPQLISPPRPSVRKRSYASAFKHPRSRHDLAMREAVRALGVDRHRFIRVELLDGRTLTGGVISIGQNEFELSRGIMGKDEISYSSLRNAPQYDAAPGEHFLNGMKWTGLAAGDVVAFPFLLLLYYPLFAAGVVQD